MKLLHTFKIDGQEFQLKNPSWKERNEAVVFERAQVSIAMRAGVLCGAAMSRAIQEGAMGEFIKEDSMKMKLLGIKLQEKIDEQKKLVDNNEINEELSQEINSIWQEWDDLNNKSFGVVEHLTAEFQARQKLYEWYVVHLLHKDGKVFFEGKDYEDKMEKYFDKIDDEFILKVFSIAREYITYWANSLKKLTTEDWEKADKWLNEAGS